MTRPLAGPQTLLRSLNARALLEVLARRGPLTRAELMQETGLSRTAVTQVIRMLEAGEFVASAGEDRATKGPAATRVSLHPRLGVAAAVHVDHGSARVALVDAIGTVRAEADAPIPRTGDRAAVIQRLIEECRAGLRDARGGALPLHAVVVAAPGVVTTDGQVRDDQGPDGGAFRRDLSARLGLAVRVENDVNLAALAELSGPIGEQSSSFALIMLVDEGIGAGFVIDGALHRGSSGLAGEVQYLPQTPLPIGAPSLGPEVIADLALAVERDPACALTGHLAAAQAGDAAATRLTDEVARRIAIICGSVSLVLDPELFVLAGLAAHPRIVDAVRTAAADYADRLPMRFATAAFGAEAALVGAVGEAASSLRAILFSDAMTPETRRR